MQKINGTIATPRGFHADGLHCGLKKKRKDLCWLYSDVPAQAAGVFTTNKVKAAPIHYTKAALADGLIQVVVVNSGNANACTGAVGLADAKKMTELTAEKLGIEPALVAVASTGIIGKLLPMATVAAGIDRLTIEGDATGFQQAILTTDTCEKVSVYQDDLAGTTVTVAGCSKGSGMIHPNMATMLGFVTTDVAIASDTLQEMLAELTETTFNQITVDGDTSTNDMVLVLANGLAHNPPLMKATPAYEKFKEMLAAVMTDLAKEIAKDGEGATKLIEVTVTGAQDNLSARMIAKTVVGSPLVKTAIFGKDPNWGRILCAVGYSETEAAMEGVTIAIGPHVVYADEMPVLFDQEAMRETLEAQEIAITVNLQEGSGQGMAWGCDLSYDYVKINALYHT